MDYPHHKQRSSHDATVVNTTASMSPTAASPSRKSGDDRSMMARSPLSNRANKTMPVINTVNSRTVTTIHNINSNTNWNHKDSSEGPPSTHDSIYDAAWVSSTSDLTKSPYQTPGRPATPVRSPIDIEELLDSESPLTRLQEETQFLYGYGTELAPILEQRSIATLRTKGSQSTSDLSSLLHDAPSTNIIHHSSAAARDINNTSPSPSSGVKRGGNNNGLTIPQTQPQPHPLRHQHSLSSLDDKPENEHSSSPPPSTIDLETHSSSSSSKPTTPHLQHLIYSRPQKPQVIDVIHHHHHHQTYPRKPLYPPPLRTLTPPTIRHVSRPRSEGDAYIASPTSTSSYTSPSSRGVVKYSVPRGPRSGHGTNLAAHPFLRGMGTPTRMGGGGGGGRRVPRDDDELLVVDDTARGQRMCGGMKAHSTIVMAESRNRGGRTGREGGGMCKKCRHPRDELWSLKSTVVGRGSGMRRGNDWCSRCAWRKMARGCCGEDDGED